MNKKLEQIKMSTKVWLELIHQRTEIQYLTFASEFKGGKYEILSKDGKKKYGIVRITLLQPFEILSPIRMQLELLREYK